MPQLMLVNPRSRKKAKPKRGKKKMAARRKRRTPAQIRATKKLIAFNRRRKRGAATPKRRRRVARAGVPIKPYARSRRKPYKRPSARLVRRRKKNNVRGYYPNPRRRTARGMAQRIIRNQLQPAAVQAGGALLLDIGYGYFGSYIPAQFNTGMLRHATKGVIAIGLGWVAQNFMRNETANQLATGALTITMHDAMKEMMANFMPNIPLGDVGYWNASPVYPAEGMGYFQPQSQSGYSDRALGYFSSDTGKGYRYAESEAFDTSDI